MKIKYVIVETDYVKHEFKIGFESYYNKIKIIIMMNNSISITNKDRTEHIENKFYSIYNAKTLINNLKKQNKRIEKLI